jgi:hypothetical protein
MRINLFLLIIVLTSTFLYGDSAPIVPADGSTVLPVNDEDIILQEETINIYMYRKYFYVEVDYVFKNTGRAKNISMGFPNEDGFEVKPIEDFKAFESDNAFNVYEKIMESYGPSESPHRILYYECFDVHFDANETKNIRNTYSAEYSNVYGGLKRYVKYILTTGALWHEDIDNVRVNIYIEDIPPQELYGYRLSLYGYEEAEIPGISFSPEANRVDETFYYMEFKNIEPDFDIKITLPRLLKYRVEASSELEGSSSYSYSAENISDYDPSTSWVEGVRGDGIGEFVDMDLRTYYGKEGAEYFFEKIGIINGFAENSNLFNSNNRVKTLKLTYEYCDSYDDRDITESVSFELQDTMDMQYYRFDKPLPIEHIKITIEDVYSGTRWDDTCIAEFQLFPAHP